MSIFSTQTILTVSQLTGSIKSILENEYKFIRISGEISNLSTPYSGHSYFILKDGGAQIRAVLFKQQKKFLSLNLQNGNQVICFGRITVYEPRGEYQIIVDTVEHYGTGRLQIAYEQLKSKLSSKGYFAEQLKKKIPQFPGKVVVITSATGAVIHDFLTIVNARESHVNILILPVKVQGKGAAKEISKAIKTAEKIEDVEIIILCRGGGSLEDLWAFNEEIVAKTIYESVVPVVTGIGHETDFTIADFCADLRCPTPTGAAEAIIPNNVQLKKHCASLRTRISNLIEKKTENYQQKLNFSLQMLGDLHTMLDGIFYRLDLSRVNLLRAMEKNILTAEQKLMSLARIFENNAPMTKIHMQKNRLDYLTLQLQNSMKKIVAAKGAALANHATLLNGVSPLATLGRGYSIVRRIDEVSGKYKIVCKSTDINIGAKLNILLHKGQLECRVTDKNEEN